MPYTHLDHHNKESHRCLHIRTRTYFTSFFARGNEPRSEVGGGDTTNAEYTLPGAHGGLRGGRSTRKGEGSNPKR